MLHPPPKMPRLDVQGKSKHRAPWGTLLPAAHAEPSTVQESEPSPVADLDWLTGAKREGF